MLFNAKYSLQKFKKLLRLKKLTPLVKTNGKGTVCTKMKPEGYMVHNLKKLGTMCITPNLRGAT